MAKRINAIISKRLDEKGLEMGSGVKSKKDSLSEDL